MLIYAPVQQVCIHRRALHVASACLPFICHLREMKAASPLSQPLQAFITASSHMLVCCYKHQMLAASSEDRHSEAPGEAPTKGA